MKSGLYIHIPFCASRCIYCGFYSTTLHELQELYVDTLIQEMQMRQTPPLQTIYLGGGTPSQLSSGQLRRLFDAIFQIYPVESDAEITIECNPDDLTTDYLTLLATLPVNRVSMGIQTFDDQRLRYLHRRHTSSQAINAVEGLRRSGIDNISIDLMFAFPDETLSEWQADLQQALALGVEHISAYSLMIEEGTPLYRLYQAGKISEIDEDTYVEMYDLLVSTLVEAGYEHYEISNFARLGRQSRHNSSYWNDTPYIGLGAAAHSYDLVSRQHNVADVKQYIDSIRQGHFPSQREMLTPTDHYNDLITTALRTSSGISLSSVRTRFGHSFLTYLLRQATPSISHGWLTTDGDHLHLTRKGIAVSDTVMSDLIMLADETPTT